MDSGALDQVLTEVEVSEWLDWLRRDLPMGGINMPTVERCVLYIGLALSLAARVKAAYRHLPETLRYKLVRAAIIHECWDSQRRDREHLKHQKGRDVMYAVGATDYLGRLGESGAHHLVEASDGFRYAITLPRGLWVETLPATEAICAELARLLGLSVPTPAIVSVEKQMLNLIDQNRGKWGHARQGEGPLLCCGSRYVETPADASPRAIFDPRGSKNIRIQLLGRLVFDTWVQNFRPAHLLLQHDAPLRCERVSFFDHSKCLSGADWNKFLGTAYFADSCPRIRLSKEDEGHLDRWVRKVEALDMNPIWQLTFEMPSCWYGSQRAWLSQIVDMLETRKRQIKPAIRSIVDSPTHSFGRKKPCKSERGCPTGLACRLSLPAV